MKIVALVLAALVVFAGALTGVLAATGNLNGDAVARLMGKEVKGKDALPPKSESADMLADENRKRQVDLDDREKKLAEREKQITQREKDLADLRTQLETMKAQVDGAVKNNEQERQTQMETIANTLVQMKPDNAAQRLEKFTPEEQADVLKRITKVKDRAKILEAMKPESAARVMQFLQNAQ